ncbi:Uncharacterized iron-regulated membrane protein [Nitrosomonas eutropha]|uniref:PepSY-associated TM helix domain-containing protein n=1 Tax=Nitrosomonas TaxID=914 RepID=UPI00088CFA75|nr:MULTISPECIES: PepSY-associated TM helix domain-containing protein [Nitrosomonas]MXS81316.1 PepSY domain-containing protein [Nitrosomonas sp. GH22]SCX25380.1 Uncharacterized iron-regulated membrane protein [Nitrosomonas eutropha]SDX06571.1 Uncharacterized iron-regulated membrane protein [Nitrosomonas eutropha]
MTSTIRSGVRSRSFWVRLHRYVGLVIAVFLIALGLTGSVIAFERELDAWLNPELFHVPERAVPVLSLDTLARHAQQFDPEAEIITIRIKRDHGESIRVDLKTEQGTMRELFLNPFSGEALGARVRGAFVMDRAHVIPMVYRLHTNLYLPGRWGVWLLGGIALIWMVDCLVGFYLTLPPPLRSKEKNNSCRNWLSRWKPSWSIKRQAGQVRFNFDLHRASGLWLWPVLFMMAMSGTYFNLNAEVFRPIVGLFGDLTPDPRKTLPGTLQSGVDPVLGFSDAVLVAHQWLPAGNDNLELSFVRYMPALNVYRVAFDQKGRGSEVFAIKTEQVFIDGNAGTLTGRRGYDSGTRADRFLAWQFPIHSGQILGIYGRVLICITGILTAMLTMTGVVIWRKKCKSRRIK